MTKQAYLDQLRKYLKKLPAADYADAMEYFTEYFEEADEQQAQQLMRELGTPKEAARELIQNLLDKKITEQTAHPKKKSHMFWVACLAICAAPIGVPLLIALLLVLCALCICAAAIVLSIFCCALAFFLAGGKLLVKRNADVPEAGYQRLAAVVHDHPRAQLCEQVGAVKFPEGILAAVAVRHEAAVAGEQRPVLFLGEPPGEL